jgi:plastocyanin
VWGSSCFHTISFIPLPPSPEFILPEPQEAGPPHLYLNMAVLMPAKPAAVYDPLQYFNSGDTGFFSMNGASWALTFEEPGVYEYSCLVHEALGMRGTVTVVGR